jgi:hypothetical protein
LIPTSRSSANRSRPARCSRELCCPAGV